MSVDWSHNSHSPTLPSVCEIGFKRRRVSKPPLCRQFGSKGLLGFVSVETSRRHDGVCMTHPPDISVQACGPGWTHPVFVGVVCVCCVRWAESLCFAWPAATQQPKLAWPLLSFWLSFHLPEPDSEPPGLRKHQSIRRQLGAFCYFGGPLNVPDYAELSMNCSLFLFVCSIQRPLSIPWQM